MTQVDQGSYEISTASGVPANPAYFEGLRNRVREQR